MCRSNYMDLNNLLLQQDIFHFPLDSYINYLVLAAVAILLLHL